MRGETTIVRKRLVQGLPLAALMLMAGFAVAGPSGLLAWGENQRALDQRRISLVDLQEKRDRLRNRVDLLAPDHVDPDLAGELLRSNLNVARPDEKVLLLP
ncbi:septum formation initiator [Novosphingobium profundi]|nr:septum formation initiator [Novosphingobium profundi]MBT0671053.1 septum formation initiator [Novosphingobium profundi]